MSLTNVLLALVVVVGVLYWHILVIHTAAKHRVPEGIVFVRERT